METAPKHPLWIAPSTYRSLTLKWCKYSTSTGGGCFSLSSPVSSCPYLQTIRLSSRLGSISQDRQPVSKIGLLTRVCVTKAVAAIRRRRVTHLAGVRLVASHRWLPSRRPLGRLPPSPLTRKGVARKPLSSAMVDFDAVDGGGMVLMQ